MIKDGDYVKQSGVATNLSNTTPQLGAGAYYFSSKETSMPNKRPDAWSTIPVSVLVGAQLRNNVVEDSNTVEPYKAGGNINASLTERDYIGLSDASLAVQASSQRENSSNAKAYDLECKDVELRLGIGPCNGGVSSAETAQDAGWLGGSRVGGESRADSCKAAPEGSLSSSKSGKSALTEQANSRNEQFFPHSGAQVSFQGWAGEQQQQPSLGKYVLYKGYPSGAQMDGVAAVAAAPQQQQQRNDLSPLHHAKPGLTVAPAGGDHHLQSGAAPSPTIQNFWHQAFRVNLSSDPSGGAEAGCYNNYTAWGPGLAPGRFVIPVPKVSTVPAKRPYLEAIGDNRAPNSCNTTITNGGNIAGSACSLNTPADGAQLHSNPSCSSATPAVAAAGGGGGGGGMYTWSANAVQIPGGWQNMSFDQGNNMGGFGKSSLPIVLPPPTPPHFKVPPTPISHNQPPLDSTGSEPSSSSKGEGVLKSDSQNDDSRNKAPVVGWPPVRSFRKNTLQATHGYKMSSELDRQETAGPGAAEASEQSNSNKNAFYVKAKLDGVRICRKVDLKSYDSYDSLKSALQEMFQGFVNDNAKLDLLHGNNYVLTHEDKDGDCLLVGDVPWQMFVASTVKSFRIMKAADATGIGEKVSAKLKAQTNCKL